MGLREVLTLRFLGRKKAFMHELLAEARRLAEEKSINKTTVYGADLYNGWGVISRRNPRPLPSVILDNHIKEQLCADIRQFLDSEKWYETMAIPFHRGYLFYGTPGSGKSSLCRALAGEFGMDIYLLNIMNLSDARLISVLPQIPSRSVLLLEDIDSAFVERNTMNRVTYSGLLNALDGINAKDGLLVFMTTNHIDKLNPSLLRPGRIDVKLSLGSASASQSRELFLRFFPENVEEAGRFSAHVSRYDLSMAMLQEYLLQRRNSLDEALGEMETLENVSGEYNNPSAIADLETPIMDTIAPVATGTWSQNGSRVV